jgi:acyl-coenzyme A synthetase/AMP-(fatty) acid ligase
LFTKAWKRRAESWQKRRGEQVRKAYILQLSSSPAYSVKDVIIIDEDFEPSSDLSQLPEVSDMDFDITRSAFMLYTSGTTGKPKGVNMTHKSLTAQAKSMTEAWHWTSDDKILHVVSNIAATIFKSHLTVIPSSYPFITFTVSQTSFLPPSTMARPSSSCPNSMHPASGSASKHPNET